MRGEIVRITTGARVAVAVIAAAAGLSGCASEQGLAHVARTAHRAMRESHKALAMSRAQAAHERVADHALRARIATLAREQEALALRLHDVHAQNAARARALPAARAKAAADALFPKVVAQALALAKAPYKAPPEVGPPLSQLTFNQYQQLSLVGRPPGWQAGTPFHLTLDPAGYLFRWPETIDIVAHGKVQAAQLPFAVKGDPALAKTIKGSVPPAGFNAETSFGKGPPVNEFLSVLGASYFRAVGAGQSWGLSARGIAVDTALPHRAEEFPYFQRFWIVASHKGAHALAFCALLNSPSLTGAYRFLVRPGSDTIVGVKAVLFERKAVRRLGIAPLTSMFLQGRFSHHRFDHLVRAAHDSDGLAFQTASGGRLWWPLRDPKRIAITRFPMTSPRGFGLLQRARRARDYRAYGMHYEKRPNAWVQPEGHWGPGHLLLVELPTNSQNNDNISVFWVPKTQAAPLQPMTFRYRIVWSGHNPRGRRLDYVAASRHADNTHKHEETYVVDFKGAALSTVPVTQITPAVHIVGPARLVRAWVTRNAAHEWRLQFDVARTGAGPVTLHAALQKGPARVSETWGNTLPARD